MTDRSPPTHLQAHLQARLLQTLSVHALQSLPDDELLARLSALLAGSRRMEADLVAHIGEVDARRLYRREAASSMFAYCTDVLHLSEHEAYLRITVARAAREHPILLELLGDGRLHLSAIAKLAPVLAAENRDFVLRRACHRSKREIEELVAELVPRPDVPSSIRKLPERFSRSTPSEPPSCATSSSPFPETLPLVACPVLVLPPGGSTPVASHPSSIQPLAPDRYRVQFTASRALRDTLDRLGTLMPGCELAEIIERAVTETLARLEAKRFAKARRPRAKPSQPELARPSRHIPAAVRRAVHERDGGRCRFVSTQGERCRARERLEFHHVHPWALGGDPTVANIRLMCRAHNVLLAEHDYGSKRMIAFRRVREARTASALEPP